MLGGLIRGCGLGGLGRRVVDWKRHITYEVRVFTGNQRGAGTSSNVFVSLQGSRDHTDQQYLYGGRFERASVEKFVIEAPFDIGEIRSVVVGTDETGPTGGWYLDKVEINGQAFPCKKWFGKDAYGKTGPLSQVLTPNEENSLNSQALRSTMPSAKEFRLLTAADVIPHPEKQKLEKSRLCTEDFGWAGEDSYFCFSKGRKNLSIGVADGVHQWREKGIDAGEYSRELMKFAEDYIIEIDGKEVLRPVDIMREAHKRVQQKQTKGSCTACIVTIDHEERMLHSANLGDSGFLVLGEWDSENRPRLIFKCEPQEHTFGYPYQLGHDEEKSDSPGDAQLAKVSIREHDLIICGTDGLFDNLHVEDMISIVQQVANDPSTAKRWEKKVKYAASQLAQAAFDNSLDRRKSTPYSDAASDEFQLVYTGGKADDITVIIAFVRR